MSFLLQVFQWFNQLIAAWIGITAFALLLYALAFNLRDRVARTFAVILVCVVIVFVSDAIISVTSIPSTLEFWLRIQWIGIIFLPPSYLHFSDGVLATTGAGLRGRQRWFIRLTYLVSLAFLLLLPSGGLVGKLIIEAQPAPHLERTPLTWLFTAYYAGVMALAWRNFWQALRRTVTSAGRRRMKYLLTGALAPALGSYQYLLFGSTIAAQHPWLFWMLAMLSNLFVVILLVVMAYAVAFFGVLLPDRVVRRRLFKWLLRGPVTAIIVLAVTTLVRRAGAEIGFVYSALVPISLVGSLLITEYMITLFAPVWERVLIYGRERSSMQMMQSLQERVLTLNDLRQFLEAVLAAACDRLQSSQAFVATMNEDKLEMLVTIPGGRPITDDTSQQIFDLAVENGQHAPIFGWGNYWLLPLYGEGANPTPQQRSLLPLPSAKNSENLTPQQRSLLPLPSAKSSDGEGEEGGEEERLLGLLGVERRSEASLDKEQRAALLMLAQRAALALEDRRIQQSLFRSLQALSPQMEMLQRMQAAARYSGAEMLSTLEPSAKNLSASDLSGSDQDPSDITKWVKDALTHYWGGPRLTENPLLQFQIVQQTSAAHEGNPANALRSILRAAIDRVRPEGERRFTGEWILYNILEMKFMEGHKVREIAARLAMSEADLYRKQRVAIESVAAIIVEMERAAQEAHGKSSPEARTGEKSPPAPAP